MTIAALILAAGRSTRMGSNKMCALLDGKPLVRHVAEAALASRVNPIIVVTGHESERVEQALAGLAVTFVHNSAYTQGLSSSIKTGIAALPATSAGVLILLGDMPLVSLTTMNALMDAHAAQPERDAIVPVGDGEWGNPVLIGRRLFSQIGSLEGDKGARALLQANRGRVLELPLADPALLVDIDTPEALRTISHALLEKKGPA